MKVLLAGFFIHNLGLEALGNDDGISSIAPNTQQQKFHFQIESDQTVFLLTALGNFTCFPGLRVEIASAPPPFIVKDSDFTLSTRRTLREGHSWHGILFAKAPSTVFLTARIPK